MLIRTWRVAPKNLARVQIVSSPGRARRGRIEWSALVAAALLAGAAASHACWQLQQAQDQSRLQIRVSEARGLELERQIDALNQRLCDCQEEFVLFRKAHNGKRRYATQPTHSLRTRHGDQRRCLRKIARSLT